MIIITVINLITLIINIYFVLFKNKFPKWEYYEDGIRFYNKNKKVTIENDKPLL